jgi:ankyrin repeat protein
MDSSNPTQSSAFPRDDVFPDADADMLIDAVKRQNIKVLKQLLARMHEAHIHPNGYKRAGSDGSTPLHEASKPELSDVSIEILKVLLDPENLAYTGNLEDIDAAGDTPLTCMIRYDFKEGVEYLLKHVQMNECDMPTRDGHTPLMDAAVRGNTEILSMLIKAGAPIDLYDKEYNSALTKACYMGNVECVRILLENDASLQYFCSGEPCVLFDVIKNVNTENYSKIVSILEMLIEKGAQVRTVDSDGNTLLQLAINTYPMHTVGSNPVVFFLDSLITRIVQLEENWSDTLRVRLLDRRQEGEQNDLKIILGSIGKNAESKLQHDALNALKACDGFKVPIRKC